MLQPRPAGSGGQGLPVLSQEQRAGGHRGEDGVWKGGNTWGKSFRFAFLEARCRNAKKCYPRRSQSETVPESFLCRKTAHPNSQHPESTASAGSFSGNKSQPTTH